MTALTDLLNRCPLVDVIDISPRKGTMTLDISDRIDIPVAKRVGLVPYLPELLSALKQEQQQAQQTLHLVPDEPGSVRADFNYGPVDGDMAFLVKGSASSGTFYFNRDDKKHPQPHWFGTVYRVDSAGTEWGRSCGHMVMDDFGTLVPMKGGAS